VEFRADGDRTHLVFTEQGVNPDRKRQHLSTRTR
jgi:hypothetical protein